MKIYSIHILPKNNLFSFYLFFIIITYSSNNYAQPYRLPAAPLQNNNQSIISINKIKVDQFVFNGNTVFSDQQLSELTKNYLGKLISIEQLMQLRSLITRYYIDKGYINSGAILPDQKINSGVVKFNIVEGVISQIKIHGNKNLEHSFIKAKINFTSACYNLMTIAFHPVDIKTNFICLCFCSA